MNRFMRVLMIGVMAALSVAMASPLSRLVEAAPPIILSDEELGEVRAGDLDIEFDGQGAKFTTIDGNVAKSFDIGIGQGAFNSSQGVFTTLQAVNSAVNLNVIVNIYLNGRT